MTDAVSGTYHHNHHHHEHDSIHPPSIVLIIEDRIDLQSSAISDENASDSEEPQQTYRRPNPPYLCSPLSSAPNSPRQSHYDEQLYDLLSSDNDNDDDQSSFSHHRLIAMGPSARTAEQLRRTHQPHTHHRRCEHELIRTPPRRFVPRPIQPSGKHPAASSNPPHTNHRTTSTSPNQSPKQKEEDPCSSPMDKTTQDRSNRSTSRGSRGSLDQVASPPPSSPRTGQPERVVEVVDLCMHDADDEDPDAPLRPNQTKKRYIIDRRTSSNNRNSMESPHRQSASPHRSPRALSTSPQQQDRRQQQQHKRRSEQTKTQETEEECPIPIASSIPATEATAPSPNRTSPPSNVPMELYPSHHSPSVLCPMSVDMGDDNEEEDDDLENHRMMTCSDQDDPTTTTTTCEAILDCTAVQPPIKALPPDQQQPEDSASSTPPRSSGRLAASPPRSRAGGGRLPGPKPQESSPTTVSSMTKHAGHAAPKTAATSTTLPFEDEEPDAPRQESTDDDEETIPDDEDLPDDERLSYVSGSGGGPSPPPQPVLKGILKKGAEATRANPLLHKFRERARTALAQAGHSPIPKTSPNHSKEDDPFINAFSAAARAFDPPSSPCRDMEGLASPLNMVKRAFAPPDDDDPPSPADSNFVASCQVGTNDALSMMMGTAVFGAAKLKDGWDSLLHIRQYAEKAALHSACGVIADASMAAGPSHLQLETNNTTPDQMLGTPSRKIPVVIGDSWTPSSIDSNPSIMIHKKKNHSSMMKDMEEKKSATPSPEPSLRLTKMVGHGHDDLPALPSLKCMYYDKTMTEVPPAQQRLLEGNPSPAVLTENDIPMLAAKKNNADNENGSVEKNEKADYQPKVADSKQAPSENPPNACMDEALTLTTVSSSTQATATIKGNDGEKKKHKLQPLPERLERHDFRSESPMLPDITTQGDGASKAKLQPGASARILIPARYRPLTIPAEEKTTLTSRASVKDRDSIMLVQGEEAAIEDDEVVVVSRAVDVDGSKQGDCTRQSPLSDDSAEWWVTKALAKREQEKLKKNDNVPAPLLSPCDEIKNAPGAGDVLELSPQNCVYGFSKEGQMNDQTSPASPDWSLTKEIARRDQLRRLNRIKKLREGREPVDTAERKKRAPDPEGERSMHYESDNGESNGSHDDIKGNDPEPAKNEKESSEISSKSDQSSQPTKDEKQSSTSLTKGDEVDTPIPPPPTVLRINSKKEGIFQPIFEFGKEEHKETDHVIVVEPEHVIVVEAGQLGQEAHHNKTEAVETTFGTEPEVAGKTQSLLEKLTAMVQDLDESLAAQTLQHGCLDENLTAQTSEHVALADTDFAVQTSQNGRVTPSPTASEPYENSVAGSLDSSQEATETPKRDRQFGNKRTDAKAFIQVDPLYKRGSTPSDPELSVGGKPILVKSLDCEEGIAKGDVMFSLLTEDGDTTWAARVHEAIWRCRTMRQAFDSNFMKEKLLKAPGAPSRGRSSVPIDVDDGRVVGGMSAMYAIEDAALRHMKYDDFNDAKTLYEDILESYNQYFAQKLKNKNGEEGPDAMDKMNVDVNTFKLFISQGLHNVGTIYALRVSLSILPTMSLLSP